MKKRYIIIISVLLMIVLQLVLPPVRPFIQLPGEIYPGSQNWLFFGPVFGGFTNTFMSALVAWFVVLGIGLSLRARSRTAEEVPTGFYNFFEMVVEGAYNFAENIVGPKVKDFFPLFMTFLLYILVTNWMGLIPSWDSIGIWEHKPHFYAEKDIKEIEAAVETAHEEGEASLASYVAELESEYGIEVVVEDGHLSHDSEEEIFHALEVEYDAENKGDAKQGFFLVRKGTDASAPVETDAKGRLVGANPEAADWTIVPFLRPGATDLNFTLAFALIAMASVQYYGFKYLGVRGYLSKFFPFLDKNFGKRVGKNPIEAINIVVGLLELVSEVSKIISFAFRLLGNLFAGMVLLFVMAFLLPLANVVFFGLEFFVGLIQAVVFALLMLIFMSGATESHHGDEEHH